MQDIKSILENLIPLNLETLLNKFTHYISQPECIPTNLKDKVRGSIIESSCITSEHCNLALVKHQN